MTGPVYLGRIQISWCPECNIPILERDRCTCGREVEEIGLTPPADAYPATEGSIEVLRKTLDDAYGPGTGKGLLPEDKAILLNVIPSRDRALEVVVDGRVVGRNFYDPAKATWIFKPTLEGGARIFRLSDGKRIRVDPGAVRAILKGGSLLAPGILEDDRSIEAGDEVLLETREGEFFAVGSARMDGSRMIERNRGIACKVRVSELGVSTHILPGGQTWRDAVEANEGVLLQRESEAIDFIRETAAERDIPRAVAFSGGKDSLCILLLARKALDDFHIIFVDTGIEFPETVSYTREIIEKLGMSDRLIVRSVGDRFWEAMEMFGPPSRDARWCCKVCKLGPTASVIQQELGGSALTFVGQRRYESEQRKARGRVSRNPWVPGQVNASPIRDWTALHVWLYLMREDVELNPLYGRGYSRIGCYVCPASDMAEFDLLHETHPELAARHDRELEKHRERSGRTDSWIELGLWRWRDPPGWVEEPADGGHDFRLDTPEFAVEEREGGLAVRFQVTGDRERALNLLNSIGEIEPGEGQHRTLSSARIRVILNEDGELTLGPSRDRKGLVRTARKVASCLVKASHCVSCGTCVAVCPVNAIDIVDGKSWIGERCTHCGRCIGLCPLLTWGVDMGEISADIFQVERGGESG